MQGSFMGLTYEISRIQCAVELNSSEWIRLNDLDYLDIVNPALVKEGALDSTVDYNEHFGSYLYFAADNEIDARKVTKKLEQILKLI